MVTYYNKVVTYVIVIVIQLYDTEKIIEDSKTDNIIIVLKKVHKL